MSIWKICTTSLTARCLWVLLLLSSCSSAPPENGTPPHVGIVTESVGYPEVRRNNQTYILAAQARIYPGDIIKTDKNSRLLIRMIDATTFRLGPNSHFVMHEYDWSATKNAPVARMSLLSGAVRTSTARLMAAKRPRFEIRTPLAVIGVRGTDFWSGFLFGDNTLDVAMIDGSGVFVENEHGSIDIYNPGWGTTVIGGSAPQPPKAWSQQKIDRALAETDL